MSTVVTGKVVMISGAAGGLGAALCNAFARAGARVVALDRDGAGLDRLMLGIRAANPDAQQILAIPCNVTDEVACSAATAEAVAHFGGVDVLVNNAGISHRSLLSATTPGTIRQVMAVNFFGAVHLTHAALPHIVSRRGSIAAISSVAGFAPLIGRTGYAASKHALHGFFDSLRSEVEDAGVSVTLVAPSFIATGIGAAALGGAGGVATQPRTVAGGESTPEDIALRILKAIGERRALLLPDRTSRLAWWVNGLFPHVYARMMKRRVGSEFGYGGGEPRHAQD